MASDFKVIKAYQSHLKSFFTDNNRQVLIHYHYGTIFSEQRVISIGWNPGY